MGKSLLVARFEARHERRPDDTVTVPRDLLLRVLRMALADSRIAERHSKVETDWEGQRARINELRRAAGMEADQ